MIVGEFRASFPDVYPDLGFAPPPTPTGNPEPVHGYKSTVLSVSAFKGDTETYDAVYDFLKYLYVDAGKDAYWNLAELISIAPARADLLDDPRLLSDPGLAMAAQMQATEHDPVEPPGDMNGAIGDAFYRIFREGSSVEAAMEILNTDVQAIFDRGLGTEMQ